MGRTREYSDFFENWYTNTFYDSASIYRKINPGDRTLFFALSGSKTLRKREKRLINFCPEISEFGVKNDWNGVYFTVMQCPKVFQKLNISVFDNCISRN